MPRTPKPVDGETPKKSTRKATSGGDDSTKVVTVKSISPKVAKAKTIPAVTSTAAAEAAKEVITNQPGKDVVQMVSQEERIRIRAYELYLRRGGRGGSPEQDWLQAVAEIYRESVA